MSANPGEEVKPNMWPVVSEWATRSRLDWDRTNESLLQRKKDELFADVHPTLARLNKRIGNWAAAPRYLFIPTPISDVAQKFIERIKDKTWEKRGASAQDKTL